MKQFFNNLKIKSILDLDSQLNVKKVLLDKL